MTNSLFTYVIVIALFWICLHFLVRSGYFRRAHLTSPVHCVWRWRSDKLSADAQVVANGYYWDCGILAALLLSIAGVLAQFFTLGQTLRLLFTALTAPDEAVETDSAPILVPVLPGVNLPLSALPLYFVTLLLHAIWHESAHAVAAIGHRCRVRAVGLFVLLVYPGAFVELDENELNQLRPWHRLRIVCGGAFHNLQLAAAAFAAFKLQVASILFLIFVSWTAPTSDGGGALLLPRSLAALPLHSLVQPHERVLAINNCNVVASDDFRQCLSALAYVNDSMPLPAQGYCVADEQLRRDRNALLAHNTSCCAPDSVVPLQCFVGGENNQHYCLSSRIYDNWHSSEQRCSSSRHITCPPASTCIEPKLDAPWERLIRLTLSLPTRFSNSDKHVVRNVMYRGTAEELWETFEARDSSARFALVAQMFDLFGLTIENAPDYVESFFFYMASLGLAMAMFNVAPVYRLDGEHALRAAAESYNISLGSVERILKVGTLLTITTISLALINLFLTF